MGNVDLGITPAMLRQERSSRGREEHQVTGVGAIEWIGRFGNNNAPIASNSHVDLPSEVKVLQAESSLEDSAGLAAWVGTVHYINTVFGVL